VILFISLSSYAMEVIKHEGVEGCERTLATERVCCSMASWTATRSCSRMQLSSSTQHTPPSASTSAPAHNGHVMIFDARAF